MLPFRRRSAAIAAATLALTSPFAPSLRAEVQPPSPSTARPSENWAPDRVFAFDSGPEGLIETGVWLPSDLAEGSAAPLIVISHGNSGGLQSHGDTARALSSAGFIVAALTHPGDNYRDGRRSSQLTSRAQHLSHLIDYMTGPGFDAASPLTVDADRIGAFGFSAGGFTVTTAIGGRADLAAIRDHCAAQTGDFACRLLAFQPIDAAAWRPDGCDARIKAAVIAAPALGYAFDTESLNQIRIPVQLWRAEDDEILPSPYNVEPIRDRLGASPEYHVAQGAGHYDFLPPCSPALAASAPAICTPKPGFDRAAFHAAFNNEVVRFFKDRLSSASLKAHVQAANEAYGDPAPSGGDVRSGGH